MSDTEAARRVLHAWAVETTDEDGSVWSSAMREEATRLAGDEAPALGEADTFSNDELGFLDRRASHLEGKSGVTVPSPVWQGWLGWVAVAASFLIGLGTNALGDEKIINILAFPLLGLVAWNLLIYLIMLVSSVAGRESGVGMPAILQWLGNRSSDRSSAAGLFRIQWFKVSARWMAVRMRALLHICAAVMVAGVVVGMYWKGLAVEYKAGWESTFISNAEPVHGFFDMLFKPASIVTGVETPTLADVEAARLGEGDAAKWIHLYAGTVALLVWLPRLLLAGFACRKARRLSRALPLRSIDPAYFRKILGSRVGARTLARVFPHRLHPDSGTRERVLETLHDLWGGSVVVEYAEPVEYGDEEECVEALAADGVPDHAVLLMNFAATPEEESQGLLCTGVRDVVSKSANGSDLIVLLDGTDYAQRLDGMPEKKRRMEERRRAWNRLLEDRGLRCAMLGDPFDVLEAAVIS